MSTQQSSANSAAQLSTAFTSWPASSPGVLPGTERGVPKAVENSSSFFGTKSYLDLPLPSPGPPSALHRAFMISYLGRRPRLVIYIELLIQHPDSPEFPKSPCPQQLNIFLVLI